MGVVERRVGALKPVTDPAPGRRPPATGVAGVGATAGRAEKRPSRASPLPADRPRAFRRAGGQFAPLASPTGAEAPRTPAARPLRKPKGGATSPAADRDRRLCNQDLAAAGDPRPPGQGPAFDLLKEARGTGRPSPRREDRPELLEERVAADVRAFAPRVPPPSAFAF